VRALLFGASGQLGRALVQELSPHIDLCAPDSTICDIGQVDQLREQIGACRPDILINAAAYTDVDRAESEREEAFAINAIAPGVMASEAHALSIPLIHYSTDYVFDGRSERGYREDDKAQPINVYGRSKLEGERRIRQETSRFLILRTSWLYSFNSDSFPRRVLEWAQTQPELRIVSDQIGSPTWSVDLAAATTTLLQRWLQKPGAWFDQHAGLYHLAGEGCTSRYTWACTLLDLAQAAGEKARVRITPVDSSAFPSPAARPAFSALSSAFFRARFGFSLPPWQQSLEKALPEMRSN